MAFALTGSIAWTSDPASWVGTWNESSAPGRDLAFAYVRVTDGSMGRELGAAPKASDAAAAAVMIQGRPQTSMWRGNFTVFLGHGRTKQIMDEFTLTLAPMSTESIAALTHLRAEGRGLNKVGPYTLAGTLELKTDRLVVTRSYDPKAKVPVKPRTKSVDKGNDGHTSSAAATAGADAPARRSSGRAVRRNRMFDDSSSEGGDSERAHHGMTSVGHMEDYQAGRKRRASAMGADYSSDGAPSGVGTRVRSAGGAPLMAGGMPGTSASPPPGALDNRNKKKAAVPVANTWCTAALLPPDAGMLAGELYEGETLGGVPHGHGTVVYRNGLMYEGQFQHGKEHGKGVLTDSDDIILYQGDFVEGEFHGTGTYYYGNGDRFIGQWKEGLWHGRGEYISACGAGYDGEWSEGLRHGQGIQKFADGSIYNGMWRCGQRHGKGDLVTPSGFRYRGTWSNDIMDGKGEASYADASRYDGGFRDGLRDGRGTYSFPEGQQYTGRWSGDALDPSPSSGTLLMPKAVRVAEDEWMIPINLGSDSAHIHMRAGFDRQGQ